MLKFEPPIIEEKIKDAISFLKEKELEPEEVIINGINFEADDYDPSDYDEVITYDSKFRLNLPRTIDIDHEVSYSEFFDLIEELKKAKLKDNFECFSEKRYLIRVETNDYESMRLIDFLTQKNKTNKSLKVKISEDVECGLVRGLTIFGFLIAFTGEYDKYFPPAFDQEYFVEITSNEKINADSILEYKNIVHAYIFELSTSLNINLKFSPRIIPDFIDGPLEEDEIDPRKLKIRPLMIGKGLGELLHLYNSSLFIEDPQVKIFFLAKVFEYVSQTVIRQQTTRVIQQKLYSPHALNPNVEFILELQNLFNEQKIYNKDKEAIKLTVITCCDAYELKNICPTFLKKMKKLNTKSKIHEKEEALTEFATSIVDTRNEFAHAKANYSPTGMECPKEHLLEFANCIKVAAQQAIRWYSLHPETLRIA